MLRGLVNYYWCVSLCKLPRSGDSVVRNIVVTNGDRSSKAEPTDWQVRWTKSTDRKKRPNKQHGLKSVVSVATEQQLVLLLINSEMWSSGAHIWINWLLWNVLVAKLPLKGLCLSIKVWMKVRTNQNGPEGSAVTWGVFISLCVCVYILVCVCVSLCTPVFSVCVSADVQINGVC